MFEWVFYLLKLNQSKKKIFFFFFVKNDEKNKSVIERAVKSTEKLL